jgi:hypothetical protein
MKETIILAVLLFLVCVLVWFIIDWLASKP